MKTRYTTFFTASLLLVAGSTTAEETIPLSAVNKAAAVIDAAIEAYGGAEALSNLNRVARKSKFTTWATNQSLTPGAPWDEGHASNFAAIDLENEQFRGANKGTGGGFDFDGGQLVNGEESLQLNYRAGTMTENPTADFNTISGPFIRVTAPLLVKQLQNRRHTSHWLGETDFEGRKHDIVTLVMEVGPALSLYFDQETHLLSRSERVLAPFGQIDYRFKDYVTIDGIPFSKTFELYANDQPNLLINRYNTEVNPDFAKYLGLPKGLEVLKAAPPAATDVELQEVEEGVFLVGAAGTFAMFVEMDDHIIAIGATAGIPERIAKLRETIEDKPIKYAVLTHHHNDHLVGVPAYEAEGAVIFTVKQHEEVVRGTAKDGDALKLEFVDGKKVFGTGNRTVEIHDIGPTPHSEHLLVAYLPDEGILFEADHFPNPATGRMVPAQPVTMWLAAALDEKGLEVKTIIGAHSARIATREDLATAMSLVPSNAPSTSW